jgi:DNA polymerase
MSWVAEKCILDFETRSAQDLKRVGMHVYAADPSTSIWCLSYKFDDGPVQRWHLGDSDPELLIAHVEVGGRVVAHNAAFERCIWNSIASYNFGCVQPLTIEQCDCTMSRALAIHLPADLDSLGYVLGLAEKKDKEGHALMMKMSRPRKRNTDGTYVWWDQPELVARLGAYCEQDVVVESLVDAKVPPLSKEERALWELDQRINDRGVMIDVAMAERCVAVLEVARERADARMAALTDGAVRKCSEALRIVAWLKGRGIPCESIAKGEHDELELYADCLGDALAREVVELRAEAGRNAPAKFRRALEMVGDNGRVRGLFGFHRALTGRWGGSGVQPHNLARFEDDVQDYLPDVLRAIEIMGEATC